MGKKWKTFGIVILAMAILLAVFDIAVWIMHEVSWERQMSVYRRANAEGYKEDYTVCSRQENVVIDEQEYLCFYAHRTMILDGDYSEYLLVSIDDSFEDLVPDENEDLEILAKEVESLYDIEGKDYTRIDVYQIDRCRSVNLDAWFWRAFMITIVVLPIEFVLGIIWSIHFVVYKVKKGSR